MEFNLHIGSKVVPFCGLYLGSYKVTTKRNYFGAYGYRLDDFRALVSDFADPNPIGIPK